ncbi:glycosyltransferase [Sinomonas sp. R1AF57]|uniref:glycosyltransferase family 2 protein n=1 Tax=Sinomonas sp. R1AF57 TaxID=2020377 RepID=UPI000B5F57FB|nr:glycosyltransferase [Sinomonas sp. R1AF57]ASN51480.1 glycosyl transferase [Sinomonas sp. R1AF57]
MLRIKARPLSGRPLVSVVVPCYNYGRFLPDALGSVLDQPGVEVEVIIVDDASTDGSQAVAEQLAASDSRVTLVQHERNQGHIATYNDGLGRVNGDYVVLLSADDLLAPGSLARSAALFEACPEVGLVYGFAPSFEGRANAVPRRHGQLTWSVWSGREWTTRVCERGTNTIVNPEAMVRRTVLDAVGGYDEAQPHAADMHFWLSAAARGAVGRVNGPDQAYYRLHGGNMHLSTFEGLYTDASHRRRVFDSMLRGGELTRSLHRRALRSISAECLRNARLSAGRGTGQGRQNAVALESLARECHPGIEGTLRWDLYQALGGAYRQGPVAGVETLLDRALWSLAWRRWRRRGI